MLVFQDLVSQPWLVWGSLAPKWLWKDVLYSSTTYTWYSLKHNEILLSFRRTTFDSPQEVEQASGGD